MGTVGMEGALLPSLRKQELGGGVYKRDVRVEARLVELIALPPDRVVALCSIVRREDPDYVPSECVLSLVRACRSDGTDAHFERLYRILAARVLRALPGASGAPGGALSLSDSRVREGAFDRFNGLLAEDRAGYSERLDFFEVRFDGAVANLRRDARRQSYREENRAVPLALEAEDGAPAEAAQAAGASAPFEVNGIAGFLYRPRLAAAIDALPPLQRTILQMLRQEIPIDSKEPGVVTIASVLDKSEKTIRTHRDLALAALRVALTQGDDP